MNKYEKALNNVRKFEREHNMSRFGDVVPQPNSDTLQELVDKETKYQALEEELGIDLITLFKALKDGIYTKNTGAYGEDLKFRYFIGDPCLEYEHRYQKIPMVTSVRTEDFNKTWWLEKPKENEDD